MKKNTARFLVFVLALIFAQTALAQQPFIGFDRNDYPGDALLPALRRDFRFTSYWLNNPPGETTNSWAGKRAILKQNGFGFLVLFNGRLNAQLEGRNAAALGVADGKAAAAEALSEGFTRNVLIFLDQEEGGRLLPQQADYIFAWIDAVRAAGARAGVYCSGIKVPEVSDTISTALDIARRDSAGAKSRPKGRGAKHLALWIADDACPPAPGCAMTAPPISKAAVAELRDLATVWQYAQSPRRMQFSAGCPNNAAPDGMCYAPGLPRSANTFVDLDAADSVDPSEAQ